MSVSVTLNVGWPFILLPESTALTTPYTFVPCGAIMRPLAATSWSRKPWKRLPTCAVAELTSVASRTTRTVPAGASTCSTTARTGAATGAAGVVPEPPPEPSRPLARAP